MKLYLVISTKVHVLVHFYLRMRHTADARPSKKLTSSRPNFNGGIGNIQSIRSSVTSFKLGHLSPVAYGRCEDKNVPVGRNDQIQEK